VQKGHHDVMEALVQVELVGRRSRQATRARCTAGAMSLALFWHLSGHLHEAPMLGSLRLPPSLLLPPPPSIRDSVTISAVLAKPCLPGQKK
jgi:hypothetical protein